MDKKRLAVDLLNNELFNSLLDTVKKDYYEQWCSSADVNERETIYHQMRASEELIGQIQIEVLETSK